jgi:hypothetical protein
MTNKQSSKQSSKQTSERAGEVALLWRGDRATRDTATPQNCRLAGVFEALAAAGIQAEPAVYADDMMAEVREQLLAVSGLSGSIRSPRGGRVSHSMRCCVR